MTVSDRSHSHRRWPASPARQSTGLQQARRQGCFAELQVQASCLIASAIQLANALHALNIGRRDRVAAALNNKQAVLFQAQCFCSTGASGAAQQRQAQHDETPMLPMTTAVVRHSFAVSHKGQPGSVSSARDKDATYHKQQRAFVPTICVAKCNLHTALSRLCTGSSASGCSC